VEFKFAGTALQGKYAVCQCSSLISRSTPGRWCAQTARCFEIAPGFWNICRQAAHRALQESPSGIQGAGYGLRGCDVPRDLNLKLTRLLMGVK
jgi:hypothetical protein